MAILENDHHADGYFLSVSYKNWLFLFNFHVSSKLSRLQSIL
jgi:hypothetical protein